MNEQQQNPVPPGQHGPPMPPHQYGQQPQYAPQPPAPQPRKSWFARHKVLTGLGAVVLVAIIGANLGGEDEEPMADGETTTEVAATEDVAAAEDTGEQEGEAPEEVEEAPAEEAAEMPGIGDPAQDGKFEFTVTELEDGVDQIGDDFLNEEAQGQFVLVHVSVENIGDEAQYFDGSSQELIDTEGRTHSADSGAAIYLDDSNSFLNEVNPGNTVDGIVVFDLPEDATPATLELHDSAFSGGVEVSLQ